MRALTGLAALAFLALSGCASTTAPATPDDAAGLLAAGCRAEAAQTWRPLGTGDPFTINAVARGPSCPQATAILTVRNPQGDVVWTESYAVAQVMTLADSHQNSPELAQAMAAWIDPNTINLKLTRDLPDWPEGAEAPMAGEFPFYPETFVDRTEYLRMRNTLFPIYCYVQGMESIACLVLEHGRLTKIGVQTFPG
ncbi:MAG: hypothetical protein GC206_05715 [Alphaproteobacteria bacterium]|nr:hypothetical protein [Alphaproteobacteria bacterium]